jgi:7,8-dihydropterin-6-yl-methyl-4-(beta-D-ribofuranosyl)aminobenzene 5'-phosphate synthase
VKLTVLVDNNTIIDRYFYAEPGVSYFIECDDEKYLFDTGYSDLFLRNATKMGINLLGLDGIVISHGHNDHTWGLGELVKLYSEAASGIGSNGNLWWSVWFYVC